MSLRYEQYWAMRNARQYVRSQFYYWIGWRNRVWWFKPGRKYFQAKIDRAYRCLRHFPCLYESGQPMWSKDEFTEDIE